MVVCGPTASGKSALVDHLGEELANKSGFKVPAVVVDSMQVYRELPVVTNQRRDRPAELTGFVPVSEEWTVARHRAAVEEVILSNEGPFMLDAGTGMYLNAIILDLDLAPSVPTEVRDEAQKRAAQKPDPRREARRIELEMTGAGARGSIWDGGLRYPTSLLYVRPPRERLDRNVAERSRRISRDGVEEVAEVLRNWSESGVEPNDSVKGSVGFQEIAAYVRGEADLGWAEEKINLRTRRLARRQMRWFDKLCESLPQGTEVAVSESPQGEKALSYMRGIIEPWE